MSLGEKRLKPFGREAAELSMSAQSSQGAKGSVAVGAVVAILIIGAVATLGYYQFVVTKPGSTTTTSSSSGPTITCPSLACISVNMTSGAGIPPGGYTPGQTTTYGFSPDAITVVIGKNNTIFWTNADSAQHTATSTSVPTGAATFDSGILSPGQTFQVTLTTPGTYHYHCSLHSWMQGTIIVVSS